MQRLTHLNVNRKQDYFKHWSLLGAGGLCVVWSAKRKTKKKHRLKRTIAE